MSPRISQYPTELPGSTSRLIGNVGSTTVGFDAGQLLGAVFTSQGQLLYAGSSKNSTFLNPPSSNAILSYSSASSAPTWIVGSSGQIFYVSSAGLTTILAAPTSGAVLTYSTINSSIGPRWEIPTSGALFGASSIGLPTWIALGTSGQVLESTGGRPTWVAYPADPTTGHITTAGTSGQVLQTTAGAAAWRNSTTIPGTIGSTIGTSGQILQTTAGVAAWRDLPADPTTGHITTAGTSGQVLQTTAGAAAWRNSTTIPGTIGSTIGTSGQILQSTGGVATWVTGTGSITTAGTSGQILQTTAGAATWTSLVNVSQLIVHDFGLTPNTSKGPLYILSHPTALPSSGEAAGLYINISAAQVETPAMGDLVGATIRVTNDGINSAPLWGADIVVQQGTAPTSNVTIRGLEVEVQNGTSSLGGNFEADPFGGTGNRANGIEIVGISGSGYRNTAALTAWANDATGAQWWDTGIALSRVLNKGISFIRNPGAATDSTAPFQQGMLDVSELTADPQIFVQGKSAGNTHLRIQSTIDAICGLDINSGNTTANVSYVRFAHNSTVYWWIGKAADNTFSLFDQVGGVTAISVATPGNVTIAGTLTVNGNQTGAADHVFDSYDDVALLKKWQLGEDLPFETGDMLNRDRLLRDTILQLHKRIEQLESRDQP